MPILDLPLVLQTRRNHGLEHATLHILGEKYPRRALGGHSNPTGFLIIGDVPVEDVRAAVVQGLARLRVGERHLAIHAGCGTNFAVSGLTAGLLAWLGMGGAKSWRSRLLRLPFVIALAAFGFLLSRPLGPVLQARVTTSGDPGDLSLVDIYPIRFGPFAFHRVVTRA